MRSYHTHIAWSGARRSRRGITLVEVLVAIVLLGANSMMLAGGIALASRDRRLARRRAEATSLAQRQIERLSAMPCTSIASGVAASARDTVRWAVSTAPGTRVVDVVVSTVGWPVVAPLSFSRILPCG